MSRVKRRFLLSAILLGVLAAGAAIVVAVPTLPARNQDVPTARVTKGPLKLTVHAVGELRAGRTVTLVAPSVGGMLRIVKLVQTGVAATSGETVVEFDPADQQYALEQSKSELAEAEQEIVKMKADAAVQGAQDEVAMLTARFDVRRAELDASGNEFIGALDAKKNLLSLEEAQRRLAQLEEDVKSRAATNNASLAVVLEKRTKAQLGMQRAEQVIDSLVLRAPLGGVVSLKENRDASGGMMFFGMILPEYRAGDQVWPGRPVADVIESGRMELRAKVDESDRGNLIAGQPATVAIDALPGETFTARVGQLSGLASRANFFDAASVTRLFDVTFQFDRPDPRLKAGVSARVTIQGKEVPDALHVPRQAVFDKKGKTYMFVKVGDRFQEREIKVQQRTESRVAISGLPEGTEIALVDPTARPTNAPQTGTPPVPAAGGPR
jgi:HlyD family secretion protein